MTKAAEPINLGHLKVKDIMSVEPITVKPGDSLTTAWLEMHRNDIKHLPVMENNRVCGVLSDRDILCELHFDENIGQLRPNTVDYAMNPDVISIGPEDPVSEVIKQMMKFKIHCVVVVDQDRELLGIVTDFDLLCTFDRFLNDDLSMEALNAVASLEGERL